MTEPLRELVLTGVPELWPADAGRALFLGPWCFAYHPTYRFREYRSFRLVPSPHDGPDDLLRAATYIDSLCDRLIPPLARLLNDLHGVEHSARFWQIVSITWLTHWLGMCHDRYQRLRRAGHLRPAHEHLRVRICRPGCFEVRSWPHLAYNVSEHAYNLQLISDIIRAAPELDFLAPRETAVTLADSPPRRLSPANPATTREPSAARLRRSLTHLIDRLESALLRRTHARCLLGTIYGVTRRDKLMLQLLLDPLTLLRKTPRHDLPAPRTADRAHLLSHPFEFEPQSNFENVIARLLPHHLPASFLTYCPAGQPDRDISRLWVGNDVYDRIELRYRIAHIVANGGRWISAQHGSGYGQTRAFPLGKIEYESADCFITWGWSHQHHYPASYHPLPAPLLAKLPRHHGRGNYLVFAGALVPAYHYRYHSVGQPEDLLGYLEWKQHFLRHLHEPLRARVYYRPYIHDYGVQELECVHAATPACRVINTGTLVDWLPAARLLVIDRPTTSLLEALAMNMPTILFWDPTVFPLHPAAQPAFEELRHAGILHDSPTQAADCVNAVWPNAPTWWRQPHIQTARTHFCRQFARHDRHWRRAWTAFLRSQLAGNPKAPDTEIAQTTKQFLCNDLNPNHQHAATADRETATAQHR